MKTRRMSVARFRVPALAGIALVSALSGLALPAVETHGIGADDAACWPGFGSDGTTSGVASPASRDQQPEHCAVCHMQRDLRGALHVRASAIAALPPVSVANDAPAAPVLTPAASATASRAPPVNL